MDLTSNASASGPITKSARRIVLKLACYFKVELFDLSLGEWADDITITDLAE